MSSTSVIGRPGLHMVLKVPKAMEEEMDAFWKEHEAWMQRSHTLGFEGDDSVAPRLLHFYIAKGVEHEDAMDASSPETDTVVYFMSETYADPAGIGKHMELGGSDMGEWFKKLTTEYVPKYAHHLDLGQTANFTSFADEWSPMVYKKGDPTITMVMKVPAEKEAEVDAFWKEHEAWMRKDHTMGHEVVDAAKPRLTSFDIRKGAEVTDPFDGKSAPTGKILYTMSESYAEIDDIKKHMQVGGANMPEMMGKFTELIKDYGHYLEVGHLKVFTSMEK